MPNELRQLLDTLIARITRTLVRGGVLIEEPEYPFLDLALDSPLEQLKSPRRCDIVSRWDLKACAQDHDAAQPRRDDR